MLSMFSLLICSRRVREHSLNFDFKDILTSSPLHSKLYSDYAPTVCSVQLGVSSRDAKHWGAWPREGA